MQILSKLITKQNEFHRSKKGREATTLGTHTLANFGFMLYIIGKACLILCNMLIYTQIILLDNLSNFQAVTVFKCLTKKSQGAASYATYVRLAGGNRNTEKLKRTLHRNHKACLPKLLRLQETPLI